MTFIGRTFQHFDNLMPIEECDFDFIDDVEHEYDQRCAEYGVGYTSFGAVVELISTHWIRDGIIKGENSLPASGEDADPDSPFDFVDRVNLFSPGDGTYADHGGDFDPARLDFPRRGRSADAYFGDDISREG